MEFFEPPFHAHYPLHDYDLHQHAPMIRMPTTTTKTNETKPRLGKDEVDILESEFQKNPKPTTQTKRQFAEDMGVDLPRINNWFQNRRAKRKQEKKQEAYEAGQAQEAAGFSAPTSPDPYHNHNGYFSETHLTSIPHPPTSFSIAGPPPPVASFNPQYTDPPTASMESLQRTLAAAQAGEDFNDFDDPLAAFGRPVVQDPLNNDQAQFLSPDDSNPHFPLNRSYSYPSTFTSNHLSNDIYPSMSELRESQGESSSQTPTPFTSFLNTSTPDVNGPQSVATFPSELLAQSQPHDNARTSNSTSESESPEGSDESHFGTFRYDVTESKESSIPPPGPSIPFKSPPPPMDIASRRKKVQVKPAALTADTLRARPGIGPRTVSHAADGFRRSNDSPLSSPMRRIVSAGGNRNVLSGRIYKSGIESAQRSPINLTHFTDSQGFLEHNFHNFYPTRNAPSLTGSSSLTSSLAPPTPMSPPGREMTFVKRDMPRSTASPDPSLNNYVFNQNVPGCFTSMEGDQNLASPPETPQAQMSMNPSGAGWPAVIDFQEKSWTYEASDEPLYTPGVDTFPLEAQLPQQPSPPSYLNMSSQPDTPFGQQFNPNFLYGGHESPHYKSESPQYTLATQTPSEYTFPESRSHFATGMSPLTKPKTFQFSHTTPADFSDK